MDLTDKVFFIMKKRALSAMVASKEIGVSHLTLGNIIHRRRGMSLATVFKLENWVEANEAYLKKDNCPCLAKHGDQEALAHNAVSFYNKTK